MNAPNVKGVYSLDALRQNLVDIAGPSSYATGGDPVKVSGFSNVFGMIHCGGNPAAAGVIAHFDDVNQKLIYYYPTGGGNSSPGSLADPAATVPTGATAVTSTSAQPTLPITPGRGKEVAASTDLSSLTNRYLVFGV